MRRPRSVVSITAMKAGVEDAGDKPECRRQAVELLDVYRHQQFVRAATLSV